MTSKLTMILVCVDYKGFALEDACSNSTMAVDSDGVAAVAALLEASDRDDWWYIVVGGQTSVQSLIENYPEAADKISTLIVMGGNWWYVFDISGIR